MRAECHDTELSAIHPRLCQKQLTHFTVNDSALERQASQSLQLHIIEVLLDLGYVVLGGSSQEQNGLETDSVEQSQLALG